MRASPNSSTLVFPFTLLAWAVFILVLSLSGSHAQSQTGRLGDPQCEKFGDRARFNHTLQKCVLGPAVRCNESSSTEEYQCGSGDPDHSACTWKGCWCRPEYFITFTSRELRLTDFQCTLRSTIGESCADRNDRCERYLTCNDDSKLCYCNGVWNETDRICYNWEYCQNRDEHSEHSRRVIYYDLFYERSTSQCKCVLNEPCTSLEGQGVPPSLRCPINSTLQFVGDADVPQCICNEGLVPANYETSCVLPPEPKQYGEACEFNSPPQCESRGSHCIDGKCECLTNYHYDPTRARCVIEVGKWCNEKAAGLEADEFVCTEHAACGDKGGYGNCECLPDFHELPDGRCG